MTSTNDEREEQDSAALTAARAIYGNSFDPAVHVVQFDTMRQAARAILASLPAPAPAAGEAVAGLAKDLGQLRQIFESWLARPANEQPVNPATGVRPFSTGDLRHLIDTMAAAQEAVRVTASPATGGGAVEIADIFQAIHESAQDERDGQPNGDIIVKGCEAAGYCDPDSAADSFKADAAQRIFALLSRQRPQSLNPSGVLSWSELLRRSAEKHAPTCNELADKNPKAGEPDDLWWERQSALREAGVILGHIAALANHSPDAGVVGEDAIRARAIAIVVAEAEEMGWSDEDLASYRRGEFDGDDLLALQAVERALRPNPRGEG